MAYGGSEGDDPNIYRQPTHAPLAPPPKPPRPPHLVPEPSQPLKRSSQLVPGPPQPPPRPRTSPAHFPHNGQYMEVRNPNEPVYEIVGPERMEGYVSETQRLRNAGVDGRTNEYQILFSPSVNMETDYVEMDELRAKSECQEPSTVPAPDQLENALTLKDEMLTEEYFLKDPTKFIRKFASTKGEMRTRAESFLILNVLGLTSDPPAFGGDLKLLTLFAKCNSPYVVQKALDTLLNEIFRSIGDTTRSHNVLAAEEELRDSFTTLFHEEHYKAKTQRVTTYGWLITLVLLRWEVLECPKIQLDQINKFDKSLERFLKSRSFREHNLFRYGVAMARESIKHITSKKKDVRDLAKRHLRNSENVLNSSMEPREIEALGSSMDKNSWLDLHICLVHLQELPKVHQFKNDPKPVTLMQKLITDYRMRYTAKLKRRLQANWNSDWKFELLVYRVLLKLIREPTCTAIIKQVVFGSRDCDGIVTYWKPNYGLVKSPFAMECLRKLCRKAIFVPYSEAREYFINLMIDKDEVHIPEELSIHYLNSLYHSQALHVSATRDSNVRRNDGLSVYDAVMAGNKCSLKIFQHSRSQALEYDQFPEDLVTFLYEIEILKVLNDASTPCPNIVRLLASGVDLPTHIIIEKATKGDLFNYLLNFKKNPILASELKKISLDICSAMIFLGERGIIHRDLRSANVLVFDSCDGEVVSKLSDFHLSTLENYCPRSPSVSRRNRFVVSSNDPSSSLPFAVRWMAVESLRLGEFSTDSDVWSFGVLLFEIFTLGCRPYENMPNGMSLYEDEDVKEFVLDGNRLELYKSIPVQVKIIIESTWIENCNERPTFEKLKSRLEEIEFNKQEKCVPPDSFGIDYQGYRDVLLRKQPSIKPSRTVCPVEGCSGDCLEASDQPVVINQLDEVYCTKEIISLECSSHVQRLSALKHPAIAVIEQINTHIENLELITEFGHMGNLVQFTTQYGCSMENAMSFLTKIAEAVTFLHNRRFIHCDLRAEAISIYYNGDVKLGRLGRARSLKAGPYGESQIASIQLQIPNDSIRWSSPEVINHSTYSQGSDVWAFGVIMWQLFTLMDIDANEEQAKILSVPYHNLTEKMILPYLEMGNRLYKPDCCPHWLFIAMQECWLYDRLERPSLAAVLDCLTHRRPFDSWMLKKWLRRHNDHLYENWPNVNVEQDEKLDHVLPIQSHSTDDDLDSLSNEEFIGQYNYPFLDDLEKQKKPLPQTFRKPIPAPRR